MDDIKWDRLIPVRDLHGLAECRIDADSWPPQALREIRRRVLAGAYDRYEIAEETARNILMSDDL